MSDAGKDDGSAIHVKGHGWGMVVPTAIVCALITAITNLAMRPTAEAHAASASPSEIEAMRQDIRETRADVKQILTRMGALEDARNNDAVINGARGRAP